MSLFQLKAASDLIGLIAYHGELAAQAGEAQRVNCAAVSLQVISAARHRFSCLREFIRDNYAVQAAGKFFFLADIDIARQKTDSRVEISMSKFRDTLIRIERFLANAQVT